MSRTQEDIQNYIDQKERQIALIEGRLKDVPVDHPAWKAYAALQEQVVELLKEMNAVAQGPQPAALQQDTSAEVMAEFLGALPPLTKLPMTAKELHDLANDHTAFKIPMPPAEVATLQAVLSAELLACLKAVPGYSWAVFTLAKLVRGPPMDLGGELTSSVAIIDLFASVFNLMNLYNPTRILLKPNANKSEVQAGSSSQLVGGKLRPDELFVWNVCTMMLCEDKVAGKMDEAVTQLQRYCDGGLPATHYGAVPGIPALATSGLVVKLCFVAKDGTVSSTGADFDLSNPQGRLLAVCCAVNLYRMFVLMSERLPRLEDRMPLWDTRHRSGADVTLTPAGAKKRISRWTAYAAMSGTSQLALETAYKAAAAAVPPGKQPFLVTARELPTFSARGGYQVDTQPLGFRKRIVTEQECQRLARACCQALQVLHSAGIAHTDVREENTVWLSDNDAMLIDLEYCRFESSPLPEGMWLCDWDQGTLHVEPTGQKRYTAASDMYSLGQMLHKLLIGIAGGQSALAEDFTSKLRAKQLTAAQALDHRWLSGI